MALADDLPLISALPSKMMKRAMQLLTDLADVRIQLSALEERKAAMAKELEEIQLNYDLAGLRHGKYAFYSVESKGRASLSKEKLLLAGVTAKTLEKCTVVGNPYRIKNFAVQTEKGWE